jgi:hypothetical protein
MRAYEQSRQPPTDAERAAAKREQLRRAGIVSLGIKREDGSIEAVRSAAN